MTNTAGMWMAAARFHDSRSRNGALRESQKIAGVRLAHEYQKPRLSAIKNGSDAGQSVKVET